MRKRTVSSKTRDAEPDVHSWQRLPYAQSLQAAGAETAQKDHGHPAYVCYIKDTNRMRADVNRNMVRSMKWASGPPGLIPEDYKCGAAC